MTQQVGDYILKKRVMEDRLGTIYRSIHHETKQPVWLKLYNSPHTQEQALQQRFFTGMQFLKKFQHPNVAKVHQATIDPRFGIYIVLEHVKGKSLQYILSEGNFFPSNRLMKLMSQLLEGVEQLHQGALIHGDLRPSTLFLHTGGPKATTQLKILHLGHGWWWNESIRQIGGFRKNTDVYLAPEQLRGAGWDHRVDIYSCGVIFAELLLGLPFKFSKSLKLYENGKGINIPEITFSHLPKQPRPPSARNDSAKSPCT